MATMVYSFKDVTATLAGIGGVVNLGMGAGISDAGLTIETAEDKNTMVLGSDGSVLHSLHAGTPATITVNILQGSPTNAQLCDMYNAQTASSLTHGRNVITVRTATGDSIVAESCAFKKLPTTAYAKDGGTIEWQFDCGNLNIIYGSGNPER